MNTRIKQLILAAGVVTMLLCSIPTKAAYITIDIPGVGPYTDWYAMGDTVSIGYPRRIYTTIMRQITEQQYNDTAATNKQFGVVGTYSTEDGYYFCNYTIVDTVVLTLSADASDNYSAVTGHVANTHGTAVSLEDLWYIKDATPDEDSYPDGENKYWPQTRVRMKVQHLKSGKWIAYSANTQGDLALKLVDDETLASPFAYDTKGGDDNHYGTKRMVYFLPVIPYLRGTETSYLCFESVPDKETSFVTGTRATGNYVKTTRSATFSFRMGPYSENWMRCFQWSHEHAQHIKIEAAPYSTTFGYAADDAAAQAQQMTQSYNISMIDSCHLYCVPARNAVDDITFEEPTVIDDASVLEKNYGITAMFYWFSNGENTYTNKTSSLEATQIDNTLSQAPYNNETDREMMTMSDAKHNGHWNVTVTPQGRSPYNVINTSEHEQGVSTSYRDLLYCNVVKKNAQNTYDILATLGTSFARRSYYIQTLSDSLIVTYSPNAPEVGHSACDLTITYTPVIVNSQIRYTADGAIAEVISRTNDTIKMNDSQISELSYKLTDVNNQVITGEDAWVKVKSTDFANNTITLTFTKNITNAVRSANLVVTGTYGNLLRTVSTYIRQINENYTADYVFKHQKGGYSEYMSQPNKQGNYYQQVHTYEKTVYYTSGEEIELLPNEPNMVTYWRWYDFDDDTDPRYSFDANGNFVDEGDDFWIQYPMDRYGNNFYPINEGRASMGIGAIYGQHTFPYDAKSASDYEKMIPKIKGWSDESEHNVALDASNYKDFINDNGIIQEPTLSYRQIWHLRPASVIADSLEKCTSPEKAYETHEYLAPATKSVYLATNMPHYSALHHQSELCYWFYGRSGKGSSKTKKLKQSGNSSTYSSCVTPKWKMSEDGGLTWSSYNASSSYTGDFMVGKVGEGDTLEMALYIPASSTYSGNDLYIAHFTIIGVDVNTYGPTTTTLRSNEEIANSYIELAKQDFNFGTPAGSLSTTDMVFYPNPLDPDNSTFSFVYTDANGTATHDRQGPSGNSATFPFYGEYCLVNQITSKYNWTMSSQHGGAANGYMMYIDGKQQPGLAATVSTDQELCSGQQMYCCAWVANAATGYGEPILRFDVQGRNSSSEDWTSVASYFAGGIGYGNNSTSDTKWQQVNFPVLSAENYKQTRIAIYNFANTSSGNDFLVDDICLYASKLPLTAYQAYTTCNVQNMEVAVARIDFSKMAASGSDQTLYYTFMNSTKDTMVHAVYHYPENWTGKTLDSLGVIYVPKSGYDPTKSGDASYQTSSGIPGVDETKMVYNSASQILDSLETIYGKDSEAGTIKDGYTLKGYVKTSDSDGERYIMYVAHLINDKFMPSYNKYKLNMASSEADLSRPECSNSADLPLSNKTDVAFNGSADPTVGACANGLYPVTVKVNNTVKINEVNVQLTGNAKADWLLGYEFDDVYISALNATDAEKADADKKFEAKYGYPRGKIQDALDELRRYPTTANFTAQSIDEIITDTLNAKGEKGTILLKEHYNIIKHLCDSNWLMLYKDSDAFYMHQEDTIRFWIYPIPGTAKVTYNGTEYELDNCSNNSFLRGFTQTSDYTANLSPVQLVKMSADQKHAVPRVRVAASQANKAFKIPISDISGHVVFGWDSCRVVSSTDPVVQALIDKNAGVSEFSMHYTQDKLFQTTSATGYYKDGDSIELKPIDATHVSTLKEYHDNGTSPWGTTGITWPDGKPGFQHVNTHKMRPGYEYTMKIAMLTQSLSDEVTAGGCKVGDVYFTILVVPDTVVWAPITDYWGDDRNWKAIINGKQVDMGYVPLPETDVVIPTLTNNNERLYPYLCDSNFYPMDAHYVPAKCHKIHFCANTAMLDQHRLSYDSVYADMTVKDGTWNLASMPLKGVVSGDFFVPHSGKYNEATAKSLENGDDFTVSGFMGTRSSDAAYAAWSRYYNDSVATEHYSTSGSYGESYNMYTKQAADNVGFLLSASNTLTKKLDPCHGFALGVWGPDNLSDENIEIRLPKPDTEYALYYEGNEAGKVSIDRTDPYKFAFTPDEHGEMKVTLKNAVASPYFLFGNPTMAYIDAESFYYRNKDVLQSYFWLLEDGRWIPHTGKLISYEDRFVKPFRAAMVYTKDASAKKEITLTLSTQDLAISYIQGARNHYTDAEHGTPIEDTTGKVAKRRLSSANGHYLNNGVMHIDAFIRPTDERKVTAVANFDLVATDFANDGYDISEDVPFFSVNIKDDGTTLDGASEMNIYSVVDTKKVSIDVREQIGVVPLGFITSNTLRKTDNGKMHLYFTLTDWTDECYLVDSETGNETRITNGTELYLDIPTNNAMRYYIQGPKKSSKDDDVPTDNGNTISTDDSNGSTISVFSQADGYVSVVASSAIEKVNIYDLLGHLVAEKTVANGSPVLTLPAPTGLLLTEVTLKNGTKGNAKVMVK